jgi:hypothetical protein
MELHLGLDQAKVASPVKSISPLQSPKALLHRESEPADDLVSRDSRLGQGSISGRSPHDAVYLLFIPLLSRCSEKKYLILDS